MFYRFRFFEEKALLKVNIYGKSDQQSMRSRLGLLANDHRWKNEYKLLIDYSGVTVIDAPKEFCDALKDILSEVPKERLPAGIAYVFPERLFCQCFASNDSTYSFEASCKISFFKHEEEASDWLEKLATECLEE
jgi:hypothetical protein